MGKDPDSGIWVAWVRITYKLYYTVMQYQAMCLELLRVSRLLFYEVGTTTMAILQMRKQDPTASKWQNLNLGSLALESKFTQA